ncbi:unnamed protein product [Anisakis simplex]|uniref:SAM domain-containing protein n=1 Tax=Anisakis simplex TaxID=6269 RepID=A0A0M3JV28_ANISI|nr:unnamed protein product [Anisakis simplex]
MSSAATAAAITKWEKFFLEAGCPRRVAMQYSKLFVEQRIREAILQDIDKTTLVELGITTIGDQLAILRHIRRRGTATEQQQQQQPQTIQSSQKRRSKQDDRIHDNDDDDDMETDDEIAVRGQDKRLATFEVKFFLVGHETDRQKKRIRHLNDGFCVRFVLQKKRNKLIAASVTPSSSCSSSSSSSRGVVKAPDRDDIYHIHMPAGITSKTRAIMAKNDRLRSVGLLKRGLSGVRVSGQEVQRYVHHQNSNKIVIASPEVSSTTVLSGKSSSQLNERRRRIGGAAGAAAEDYVVYERLGVGGLKSDALPQARRLMLRRRGDNVNELRARARVRMQTSSVEKQGNDDGFVANVAPPNPVATNNPSNEPVFRKKVTSADLRSNSNGGVISSRQQQMLLSGRLSGAIQKKQARVPVTTRLSRAAINMHAAASARAAVDIGDVLQKRFLRTQQQRKHFKRSVFDRLG